MTNENYYQYQEIVSGMIKLRRCIDYCVRIDFRGECFHIAQDSLFSH